MSPRLGSLTDECFNCLCREEAETEDCGEILSFPAQTLPLVPTAHQQPCRKQATINDTFSPASQGQHGKPVVQKSHEEASTPSLILKCASFKSAYFIRQKGSDAGPARSPPSCTQFGWAGRQS
ncbi:hypothetical protein E6O75_ATG02950 [Venturia nashicola]|uniref:Uncharacterized protein n=1 Tax=Venturia nashicola TaxID=86259 RepID=A0A4Z1PM73_9PEZI|nr:hypothetical protein E6O75_ATG02950 [Venturia nashicola]